MQGTLRTPQQIAYEHLRDGILTGRYVARSRLKSEIVAQELGISRMPVREALRQLHAEGLVTVRPNRGAIVTSLTADDVMELFEMRAVLEALATHHAAQKATAEDYQRLTDQLRDLRKHKTDSLTWSALHDQFHDSICRLSGRERLCNQVALIRQQVLPHTRFYAGSASDPEIAGYEHDAILSAMQHDGPDAAAAVMRAHIMQNAASIVEALAELQADGAPDTAAAPDLAEPTQPLRRAKAG